MRDGSLEVSRWGVEPRRRVHLLRAWGSPSGCSKSTPATDECELIGATFPGKWKWYGGLLGTDGRIYGVPQCASSVLRIDPKTGTCETFGSYPEGGGNGTEGTVGMDGAIYGIPAHADTVLKIIPGDEPEIREIGEAAQDGKTSHGRKV